MFWFNSSFFYFTLQKVIKIGVAFSKEEVIEAINCVAPDEFLDNSASLKTLHVDSDAGNEFVTNSLQRKKEVNCTKYKFS